MGARHWLNRLTPYLLLAPGVLWLLVFYAYPSLQMFISSFWSGTLETGFTISLANWTTYPDALQRYGPQFGRSLVYGAAATTLCFLIAYPLAYTIAFRGGRYKSLLLFLVIAPFFTSFLLRTIAWQSLLNDNGPVLGAIDAIRIDGLLEQIGLLDDGRLLNTQVAVIGGLTYNFLPFMLLPIYVSLEKVDIGLVDAAADLYSPFGRTFRKVILPLSLPGVFAGTLLTFIPATGDFINAELLGNPNTSVIGNVVQTQFLERNDYPTAAAISFVLMAIITVLVLIYAKFLGTEDIA